MRGFVGCRYTSIRAVAPHLCQSLGCLSHSLYQHCSQDSFFYRLMMAKGFPCGSAGKESACNVGDLGSIPGLGKSPGEGIGSPLQYSWASLVAQQVKNLPAMWGTWVRSLGWENPLEKGKVTHSSILAWRIPWTI